MPSSASVLFLFLDRLRYSFFFFFFRGGLVGYWGVGTWLNPQLLVILFSQFAGGCPFCRAGKKAMRSVNLSRTKKQEWADLTIMMETAAERET